jgi:hypothetical protein
LNWEFKPELHTQTLACLGSELTPRSGLCRIDTGPVDFNGEMDRVFRGIPAEGKRVKTNLARILVEERPGVLRVGGLDPRGKTFDN